MTLEEAVELLCYGDWLNVISEHIGKQDTERIAKAMCIVGKALRPVSREQVEKMWRGKWIAYLDGNHIMPERYYSCSKCGDRGYLSKGNFCGFCGAPMTDKAVDMVLERMDELQNEIG